MKKILVIGDSLCLPRKKPEIVEYNDTWPYLLKNTNKFEIVQIAIGGGSIRDLYEQTSYYKCYNPDIVIVQSGIVDCAPRALGKIEREIINSSRILSAIFNRFFPLNFVRRYRHVTLTRDDIFKQNAHQIIETFSGSKLIWIGILPASNQYEKMLPGISNNIKKYNEIITSEIKVFGASFIATDMMQMDLIMTDHHHLNKNGHKWIFERLIIELTS